jgi:hypothetical protein
MARKGVKPKIRDHSVLHAAWVGISATRLPRALHDFITSSIFDSQPLFSTLNFSHLHIMRRTRPSANKQKQFEPLSS